MVLSGFLIELHHCICRIFGPGQQCCYDSNGDIIPPGKPGAGTADLFAPVDWKSKIAHFFFDVVPYFLCCTGLFRDCSRYYDKRPSDDCSDWPSRPPPGVYSYHIQIQSKYQYHGSSLYLVSTVLFEVLKQYC